MEVAVTAAAARRPRRPPRLPRGPRGRRSAGGANAMAEPREDGAGGVARIEAEGDSLGAAKWAAMKDLELSYPGLAVEHVSFDILEEGKGEGAVVRIVAVA